MNIFLLDRLATAMGNYAPGSVLVVDDKRGKDLIAKGHARLAEANEVPATFHTSEGMPDVRHETKTTPKGETASALKENGKPKAPNKDDK